MKNVNFLILILVITSGLFVSCEDFDGDDSGNVIETNLHSSDLEGSRGFSRAAGDAQLVNITGKMNAVVFTVDNEAYGYTSFIANNESGPIALEGCAFEDFDLKHPPEWSHNAGDLQGPGGDSSTINFYGAYYDFTFTYDSSTEYTVRVAGGNVDPYKKGDLLIEDGGVFKWYNTDTGTLVSETETRPANVQQLSDAVNTSFPGDMILISMTIPIQNDDGSTSIFVDETISAIDIDLGVSTMDITVGTTNTASSVIQNFYVDLFKSISARTGSATAGITLENNNVPEDDED